MIEESISQTFPLEQTSSEFQELVRSLKPGEEIGLTEDGNVIAKVVTIDSSSGD